MGRGKGGRGGEEEEEEEEEKEMGKRKREKGKEMWGWGSRWTFPLWREHIPERRRSAIIWAFPSHRHQLGRLEVYFEI